MIVSNNELNVTPPLRRGGRHIIATINICTGVGVVYFVLVFWYLLLLKEKFGPDLLEQVTYKCGAWEGISSFS